MILKIVDLSKSKTGLTFQAQVLWNWNSRIFQVVVFVSRAAKVPEHSRISTRFLPCSWKQQEKHTS